MVFTSPHPDIALSTRPVHEIVLDGAAARGEHPALVDATTGTTLTYAALAASVEALAAGFHAEGLRKGDVLALHGPNSLAFPVVLLAASRIGVAVTTLNGLSTAAEMAVQLRDSRAAWMVTVAALLEPARAAAAEAGVGTVVVCDSADGVRSISDVAVPGGTLPAVALDLDEDLFVLPYSSGTTARPKGVMLSHRNVGTNMTQVQSAWDEADPDDRVMAVLPFFHIFGMCILLNFLSAGATLVVLPRFELDSFLRTLEQERITRLYAVPPIVLALAKHPAVDGVDTSSLRQILCAAAPLDADLATACGNRLGCTVVQGYGMTESSPGSQLILDSEAATAPPGTVGTLLPSTRARLVDLETGQDVALGAPGELWLHGPQIMKGYLGRPEETSATVDTDGWLHTGDVATVDADGWWYIVDRVKELIKYKGYQVPPAELEAVLLASPRIADAAVIGVYDEAGDEVPKAFVVRADATLTEDEVLAHVAAEVAPYKKVRRVEFVDAIPKAASGKILRRELRDREKAAHA